MTTKCLAPNHFCKEDYNGHHGCTFVPGERLSKNIVKRHIGPRLLSREIPNKDGNIWDN